MRRLGFGFTLLGMALLIPAAAIGAEIVPEPRPLKCDIGPVVRTYGMTQWLVYSCDDDRSVVLVSAPGNPAMPFYFMLSPRGNGYHVFGEGTGRKDATAEAFNEIKALSAREIVALIEETKVH